MRKANFIQGIYYLLTGIWPILHIESFILVTGFKHDIWLVKMVALLSISIGTSLLVKPSALLAVCTALSFATIDIYYAKNEVIPKIYLADTVVQFLFLSWILLVYKERSIRFTPKERGSYN